MRETIQSGHHPDADQITAFVEQVLPAHERREMLAHLAVCQECRATLAMSLPTEETTEPEKERIGRSWFSGWGLAWPAAAALAAMVIFVAYLNHEAGVQKRASVPPQMAVSRSPESPAPREKELGSTVASQKLQPELERGKATERDEMSARGTKGTSVLSEKDAETRAKTTNGLSAPRRELGGQGGMTNSVAVPEMSVDSIQEGMVRSANRATTPSPAPPSPASSEMGAAQQAAVAGARKETSAAPNGGPFGIASGVVAGYELKKAEAVVAQPALPSGLPVLSMAKQGRMVLGIDQQNTVFVSTDGGEHWKVAPARWTGRAVKADLVRYGSSGGADAGTAAGESVAAFMSTNEVSLPTQGATGTNSATQSAGSNASAPLQSANPGTQELGAKLTGTVTDLTGGAIPGASVTVSDATGRTARTAVTDRDGSYLIDGLVPGVYDLKTQAPGYSAQTAKAVNLKNAELNVANVALTVGVMSESVEVSAADTLAGPHAVRRKAMAKPSMATPAAPVFELTTDSGERWTSPDGLTWKLK
jgi:hypothetical protein